MAIRKILILMMVMAFVSCQTVEHKREVKPQPSKLSKALKKSRLMPPPPPVIEKTFKEFDPLENVFISMDAVNESLSAILYMVATESGLNLIISPDIDAGRPFTLTVSEMPARDVLDIVAENGGFYYEVNGSALAIKSMVTKSFKLPYVRMKSTQRSEIGGDVFGSSDSNLKGDYSLAYEHEPEKSDVLEQVIRGVDRIVFPEGNRTVSSKKGSDSASDKLLNGKYIGKTGYVFNYFTGTLKVTASPAKMREVEGYIKDIKRELSKQVLIEAKLIEVVLNDKNAYGINWSGTMFAGGSGSFDVGLGASVVDGGINLLGGLSPVGVMRSSSKPSDWFAFMASHGKIETMGNPRVRVMNGQSAMISSGQLVPYWEAEREEGEDDEPDTVTYTRVTVLDGVVMGVTPHIKDDGTITISVVPVFSDIETVKNLVNANNEIVASYPVVNLKEAATILNVRSGDTIVMGGLISNVETKKEEKIPLLGDIPLLGNVFKGQSKVVEKRELVIFLKTTIISR